MSRWVLARPGTHAHRVVRVPDGSCLLCGEDVEPVAIACAQCREVEWAGCWDCGCDWPEEALVSHPSCEGDICPDCLAELCPECGLRGWCRCDEGDRRYHEAKDEGRCL